MEHVRDLKLLPKAHLHLHFTGSMRPTTLLELADKYGVHLPDALTGGEPPKLRATDERGWFRFQRLYDIARSCLRAPEDIRRLVLEAAEEDVRDGAGWLEIQVDPTSYAPRLGGLIPALEVILDAVESASRDTGLGIRVVVAANRMKHPLDARTLARLAVRYADRGVVGFGLSNDERRGMARDFDRAFAIAREGGLLAAPHGGELTGPASVRDCLDDLRATRIGHGVRAVEDPRLLRRLADKGVTCEVCPASNVALGVYERHEHVPLRTLFDAGVPMALGADDPLLFGARLADQYEIARRHHGFADAELAELARQSVRASVAPEDVRAKLLAGIDDWLAEG
ncbi:MULTISPECIES: adenosine deaminase [Streptomyces]|uniref:Aminodeoxyfutalosine deaminase n=2 Tax=Streptomyces TaxID=1883 RepID=A0A1D8G4S1_9ACTN|nr:MULTISPECIES: adenosine deaminase [Streptomyces]AOT60437.1 Aminodeoxyfutalosine deaminase [Streptomyces rubrolavendulae]KAF0650651.1 adenosine deaminase [Streptomyces fradiae ATCC 10745 = DSM 40063]OSY52785.1 Aminodeoxyfutalosine deaminase [Streptomyces fradiae ATCC 10745 = DSM 40063]QEV13558.1 adenosine deaminase [Streptomyces fradiae ATCC 10745 = DSM 40063]UQS31198.1 adenosine deaminase [Streptomyces fradiae]